MILTAWTLLDILHLETKLNMDYSVTYTRVKNRRTYPGYFNLFFCLTLHNVILDTLFILFYLSTVSSHPVWWSQPIGLFQPPLRFYFGNNEYWMKFPIYSFIQTNPSLPYLKSTMVCLSTQYLTMFVTNFSVILWKGGKSWLNFWADSWTFNPSKNISHIKTIVWNIWKHWTYLLLNRFSFSFWWQWRWQKYTLPECFLVYFGFGSLPSYFGRYHIIIVGKEIFGKCSCRDANFCFTGS